MQFLWKYIGDLVGKGLEWYTILEFILYSIPYLIPRALPLAVLLSSIMVFGNLGERYELVAMKSAGISLIKAMTPMIYVMIFVAGVAFYSSNVLIPRANLSWGALFYDVTNKKPALNIQDGIFFKELRGFAIRVGHKHEDNQTLDDVLIYSSSGRSGVTNVVIAKRGQMVMTEDKRFLKLTLYDGKRFEEMTESPNYSKTYPHNTMEFKKYDMAIDMSELELRRSDPEMFKDNYEMLNLDEIVVRVDSFDVLIQQKKAYLKEYLTSYFNVPQDSAVKAFDLSKLDKTLTYEEHLALAIDSVVIPKRKKVDSPMNIEPVLKNGKSAKKMRQNKSKNNEKTVDSLTSSITSEAKKKTEIAASIDMNDIVQSAAQSTRNFHRIVENTSKDVRKMQERRRRYATQWHKKFTLAFSCLMLLFIGAPIGAIIRKGGFGTPMIIAILLFIVFFILQTVGEKLTREGVLEVWAGSWFAPMIFIPLAIFLTYKSNTESMLFDSDAYRRLFRKINIFSRPE